MHQCYVFVLNTTNEWGGKKDNDCRQTEGQNCTAWLCVRGFRSVLCSQLDPTSQCRTMPVHTKHTPQQVLFHIISAQRASSQLLVGQSAPVVADAASMLNTRLKRVHLLLHLCAYEWEHYQWMNGEKDWKCVQLSEGRFLAEGISFGLFFLFFNWGCLDG